MPYRNLERGWWRTVGDKLFDWTAPDTLKARVERLELPDGGLGYDHFGMEASSARLVIDLLAWLHERYFRVRSVGVEHLPQQGAYILAANHAAPFPIDALMIAIDVLLHGAPPRLVRTLASRTLASAPYLNIMLNRSGVVWATQHNMEALLRQGQPILYFPEGARAMARRHGPGTRLLSFNPQVIELGIKHRVPVVPVGVVATGAMSALERVLPARAAEGMKQPELPNLMRMTLAGLAPLPTALRVRYGAPMRFEDEALREASPTHVRSLADRLQSEVQLLVDDLYDPARS